MFFLYFFQRKMFFSQKMGEKEISYCKTSSAKWQASKIGKPHHTKDALTKCSSVEAFQFGQMFNRITLVFRVNHEGGVQKVVTFHL